MPILHTALNKVGQNDKGFDIFKALLDAGAPVDIQDSDRDTTLNRAIKSEASNQVIDALLAKQAGIDDDGVKNNSGNTPLQSAFIADKIEITKKLLAQKNYNIRFDTLIRAATYFENTGKKEAFNLIYEWFFKSQDNQKCFDKGLAACLDQKDNNKAQQNIESLLKAGIWLATIVKHSVRTKAQFRTLFRAYKSYKSTQLKNWIINARASISRVPGWISAWCKNFMSPKPAPTLVAAAALASGHQTEALGASSAIDEALLTHWMIDKEAYKKALLVIDSLYIRDIPENQKMNAGNAVNVLKVALLENKGNIETIVDTIRDNAIGQQSGWKIDLNQPINNFGQTFLHVAAVKGNNNAVAFMIVGWNKTLNVNIQDIYGATPLHYAAQKCNYDDWVIKPFFEENRNLIINTKDKNGFTALDYALSRTDSENKPKIIEFLTQKKFTQSDKPYSSESSAAADAAQQPQQPQ